MEESNYNGILSDSEPFEAFLERFFKWHKTKEDDKWWVRDWLSSSWDAALDTAAGIELTNEERRERARRLDAERLGI